ncbi:MAG: BrnT family toxin [Myxococcota bacterium]|nr:BrnT family toxin [Myxococcota bacterium]
MEGKTFFDWDDAKDQVNKEKHGISFDQAKYVFADPNRIIVEDLDHSEAEDRFYCIGKVNRRIVTVRFTYRENVIRIFGAGYSKKMRRKYWESNQ